MDIILCYYNDSYFIEAFIKHYNRVDAIDRITIQNNNHSEESTKCLEDAITHSNKKINLIKTDFPGAGESDGFPQSSTIGFSKLFQPLFNSIRPGVLTYFTAPDESLWFNSYEDLNSAIFQLENDSKWKENVFFRVNTVDLHDDSHYHKYKVYKKNRIWKLGKSDKIFYTDKLHEYPMLIHDDNVYNTNDLKTVSTELTVLHYHWIYSGLSIDKKENWCKCDFALPLDYINNINKMLYMKETKPNFNSVRGLANRNSFDIYIEPKDKIEMEVYNSYLEILNRYPDEAGLNSYVHAIKTNQMTLYDVRMTLLNSEEYQSIK